MDRSHGHLAHVVFQVEQGHPDLNPRPISDGYIYIGVEAKDILTLTSILTTIVYYLNQGHVKFG
jgi:hypothetical protein